jgi:hypothetical protein
MDTAPQQPSTPGYALTLDVEYPDRSLNRLTSAFRIFTVIPTGIVLASARHRLGLHLLWR